MNNCYGNGIARLSEFTNEKEFQEFLLSGMCEKCQNELFSEYE